MPNVNQSQGVYFFLLCVSNAGSSSDTAEG